MTVSLPNINDFISRRVAAADEKLMTAIDRLPPDKVTPSQLLPVSQTCYWNHSCFENGHHLIQTNKGSLFRDFLEMSSLWTCDDYAIPVTWRAYHHEISCVILNITLRRVILCQCSPHIQPKRTLDKSDHPRGWNQGSVRARVGCRTASVVNQILKISTWHWEPNIPV